MTFRKLHHYSLLGITLLLTLVCGILIPKVKVNSDMTKYLPDSSQMKQGLNIIHEEFSGAQIAVSDVKAMFHGLDAAQSAAIADSLSMIPQVDGVTYRQDESGEYTLFELNVQKSVDQKALGQGICNRFGKDVIVETSQDGNTPPASVLIIAACLIVLILVLMSQSWLEPIIFLLTTGIAVVLNIGTNALLPSVSITTNYIVAILQMVLSLDYSIVLINRYRQELSPDRTTAQSVNAAIHRAYPSIISSALTTIVGLIMLCFMRLKIGMDMGIVLAKGVVWSLVCAFTVLPSLLMLFHKGVMNTSKKTFVLPTDRLGRHATRWKVPLSLFALLLFFTAFWFSKKTEISFAMASESAISKVFPRMNPVVMVYDTKDEMSMIPLADSLRGIDGVENVISYPTILKQEYTADNMVDQIKSIGKEAADYMPENTSFDKLTPAMMRLVYYLKYQEDPNRRLSFPDVAAFLIDNCETNPLFKGRIDDSMREQLALLESMTGIGPQEEEEEEPVVETSSDNYVAGKKDSSATSGNNQSQSGAPQPATQSGTSQSKAQSGTSQSKTPSGTSQTETTPVKTVNVPSASSVGNISVIDFMPKLYAAYPCYETEVLRDLVDTVTLHKKMTAQEMGAFIGSTTGQTKMVYSFSKSKSKYMTPLEYVHFLCDDLFNRKSLSSMVNAEQKHGLEVRCRVMDYADSDTHLTAAAMTDFLKDFGVQGITQSKVKSIANQKPSTGGVAKPAKDPSTTAPEKDSTITTTEKDPSTTAPDKDTTTTGSDKDTTATSHVVDSTGTVHQQTPSDSLQTDSHQSDSLQTADADSTAFTVPAQTKPKKSLAEIRAELFADMMYSGKTYTSAQLARNFRRLGHDVDPNLLSLLYAYYGSEHDYDESLKMSIEDLVKFGADSLMNDKRIAPFIDEQLRQTAAQGRAQLSEGIGMLRNDKHSLMVVITDLPLESKETYDFIDEMNSILDSRLSSGDYYTIGESVMYNEMKKGFSKEMNLVTILTVLAIFLIVAVTFRSIVVPAILVMTVMTAVYVNVVFSGVFSGGMFYLAYLIVQSILMGATIDYGILFTNYYKEKRKTLPINDAVKEAYRGSIRTIMTSGLIMVAAPGGMSLLVDDVAISAIVGSLAIGALVAVVLILVVLPGVLVAFDRWVVRSKSRISE